MAMTLSKIMSVSIGAAISPPKPAQLTAVKIEFLQCIADALSDVTSRARVRTPVPGEGAQGLL